MRDLIWTVIIIWVIYRLIDVFRSVSVKKTYVYNKYESFNGSSANSQKYKPEGSVTVESNATHQKKSPKANSTDGEYIDFEEIK